MVNEKEESAEPCRHGDGIDFHDNTTCSDVGNPYLDRIFNHSSESMAEIPDGAVQCTVTSPPYYWQRDYDIEGQIGAEETLGAYRERLKTVFREVYRVTAPTGVLWLNIGDSYFGDSPLRKSAQGGFAKTWDPGIKRRSAARDGDLKPKDLMLVPYAIATDLRALGWYVRAEIIWEKETPKPSGRGEGDRPLRSHEHLFLFAKSRKYNLDQSGLPRGTVWKIPAGRCGIHPAIMPGELARVCVMAGSQRGQVVLDPFSGIGTTPLAAALNGRHYVGYDLRPDYIRLAEQRLGLFAETA